MMQELSARVTHMLGRCKNRGLFASDELWRRRTRGCIETTALFVCCVGAELAQFGDIVKVLEDIGNVEKSWESLLEGRDQSFMMHWTCLSLVVILPILESNFLLHSIATDTLEYLEGRDINDIRDEQSLTHIEKIIETFDKMSRCLNELLHALWWEGNRTEEGLREVLRNHESQISELEHINIEDHNF